MRIAAALLLLIAGCTPDTPKRDCAAGCGPTAPPPVYDELPPQRPYPAPPVVK